MFVCLAWVKFGTTTSSSGRRRDVSTGSVEAGTTTSVVYHQGADDVTTSSRADRNSRYTALYWRVTSSGQSRSAGRLRLFLAHRCRVTIDYYMDAACAIPDRRVSKKWKTRENAYRAYRFPANFYWLLHRNIMLYITIGKGYSGWVAPSITERLQWNFT